MISVNVDLSKATQEEVEYFFRLPHVGHAVDVLTHLESGVISVSWLLVPGYWVLVSKPTSI